MQVAYAVVRDDPPKVFAADDLELLHWVLAVEVVAATPPESLPEGAAPELRAALLDERWSDAVTGWIRATGTPVDVYPGLEVATHETFPLEVAAAEMQFAPLFRDH